MINLPVRHIDNFSEITTGNIAGNYKRYLDIRVRFLLDRLRKFPDFPGMQTGYDSITGRAFAEDDIVSYSWINGRGVCVLVRLAKFFPEYHDELMIHAERILCAMEDQYNVNNGRFPFTVSLNGDNPSKLQKSSNCRAYSDEYACFGFLEYASASNDQKRGAMAREIFDSILHALETNQFVTEPDLTPAGIILENPWSVALDLSNEFYKQLQDDSYLDVSAQITGRLLDLYLKDTGVFCEYVDMEGKLRPDENGRFVVDPGHAIEFACFALEYCRLAEKADRHPAMRKRIREVVPAIIIWNFEKGWNRDFGGFYKTIDANTSLPINSTMPWWTLPEAMLVAAIAFENTGNERFLEIFTQAHNVYFGCYMNEKTEFGPYQNRDGKTGKPINIVPACKFQDPEFHSGKNIMSVIQVMERCKKTSKETKC